MTPRPTLAELEAQARWFRGVADLANRLHTAPLSPCWGCGRWAFHRPGCPALAPRPERYLVKRLAKEA